MKRLLLRLVFLLAGMSIPVSMSMAAVEEPTVAPGCHVTEPLRAEPARDPNADPFGSGPWYLNKDRTIWAGWDAVRMRSAGRGNKVLWIRPQGTQLTVTGRRLDAESVPMKASIPGGYPTGFQASNLYFPSEGCWEINAKAGKSELTFITTVRPAPTIEKE